MSDYPRNMIGYGTNLPKVQWPNNARLALQIVLNYEEGGENNILSIFLSLSIRGSVTYRFQFCN